MKLVAACALTATLLAPHRGLAQHLDPRPEPPREFGMLDVESEPTAEIAIDGADTGLWTPQHRLRLPAGHHNVTFFRRERRPSTYGFIVRPGEVTHLTIHLAPPGRYD
jgi:hypothetical protein